MGFRVHGSRCEVWVQGSGLKVKSLRFRGQGLESGVQGLGFRVQGIGFRVSGLGFRVQGSKRVCVREREGADVCRFGGEVGPGENGRAPVHFPQLRRHHLFHIRQSMSIRQSTHSQ